MKHVNNKDVEKYYKYYEAYMGTMTTQTLIDSFLVRKAAGMVLPIKDVNELQKRTH